jgi:hypothetical protein
MTEKPCKKNKRICRPHKLKVPKRKIFDRSDFPDFYTIKPLRVGNFGVKIKKKLKKKIFRGSFRGASSLTYAQSIFKEVFSPSWGQHFFFCRAIKTIS